MKQPNARDVLSELIKLNLDPGLFLNTNFDNLVPETAQTAMLYSIGGENPVKVKEAIGDILTRKNFPQPTWEAVRLKKF